ncbi:MAG: hypothetical protein AAF004_10785 [Pseudomonadota bacterium]
MPIWNVRATAVLAACLMLIPSISFAEDPVTEGCQSEIADASVCGCAAKRLGRFLGTENFKRYAAFFNIYVKRHAEQIARGGETLSAWNGAMARYAKESGEDQFEVMGWVPDYQYAHRYALKACGAAVPDAGLDKSLLFYGESR